MSGLTLAKLDHARLALAESRTLSEVMKIKDVAEAAKTYAKAAHLGRESQNYAAEIALLASRKAGELLSRLERSKGGEPTKKKNSTAATLAAVESPYSKALNETSTPDRTARYWQKLARVPEEVVKTYIAETIEARGEISSSGLLKAVPHAEKRKNRGAPLSSQAALFELCRKIIDAGYKTLMEQGGDPSHLYSAKSWMRIMVDDAEATDASSS